MFAALRKLLDAVASPGQSARGAEAEPVAPAKRWADSVVEIQGFDRIEAQGNVLVQWTPGATSCVATVDELDPESASLSVEVVAGALRVKLGAGSASAARVVACSKALRSFDCAGLASGTAMGIEAVIFEAGLVDGQRLLLTGKAVAAKLRLTGKGQLQADGLLSHTVIAKVDGAGLLEAKAESVAEVSIGGGGEAIVFGDPKVIRIERTGAGRAQVGSKVGPEEVFDDSGIFGQMPIPRS